MTIQELHALALAKVLAAFDATGPHSPDARGRFYSAAKDGLAQIFQIVACQLADAKDAGRAEAKAREAAAEAAFRGGIFPGAQ